MLGFLCCPRHNERQETGAGQTNLGADVTQTENDGGDDNVYIEEDGLLHAGW